MFLFKDENRNRTVSSLRKFEGETAFRLLHENHIEGDENYLVIFNLIKRTAAVQFAPDFAVTHRYKL